MVGIHLLHAGIADPLKLKPDSAPCPVLRCHTLSPLFVASIGVLAEVLG